MSLLLLFYYVCFRQNPCSHYQLHLFQYSLQLQILWYILLLFQKLQQFSIRL
nr:MAG TPA: hypothetical protein [Caudoviricetes sp.]